MKARMRKAAKEMIVEVKAWVKALAEQADRIASCGDAEALERSVRQDGRAMLATLLEKLLQAALDHQPQARSCPRCGRRRRHKGIRPRGLISSVGDVRLRGPYWYCPACRTGQHAADVLAPKSISGVMRELLCLLGTSLASFAKASRACQKLLGVRLDAETIRQLCHREGIRALGQPPRPPEVPKDQDLVGSCDGTMINTRAEGWRELKAYRFEHAAGSHGGAFLEPAKSFTPRLRRAAIAMRAAQAGRLFFVSDAADWIDKGVSLQLPTAVRIVDIWHAYQHIYQAARKIFGEGTAAAERWAKRYCRELLDYGGRVVWNSLRRVRYKDPARQSALEELLTYLDRQADRMDYPTFRSRGYPISSGPMESFCKQLGQRLKGPGMRWSVGNVNPMAALVSLWTQEQWDSYWVSAA